MENHVKSYWTEILSNPFYEWQIKQGWKCWERHKEMERRAFVKKYGPRWS